MPSPERKRGYITHSLRFDTFAKCDFRCHFCGVPAAEARLEVDHVVPVTAGGTSEPHNLVAACAECNAGKSSKLINCPPVPESLGLVAVNLGRKPLGGTGEKTVMVPMRWAPADLARIDAARGETDRSTFIRTAVERELARREE